jgi:glycosyltransferase involved in cell wall biosynthesis
MEISVIFPAYNETQRIGPVLRSFSNYLATHYNSFELIVVDDGSTDGTSQFVKDLRHEIPALHVLTLPQNRGKGHAVRVGMLMAKGKIRLFSDADGSTPAEEIGKLLKPLLADDADISIGSRYTHGSEVSRAQPLFRRVWSRLANGVVQMVLLPGIADMHCGFKAFSEKAVIEIFPSCNIDGWSFDLEVLALARKRGLRIKEVPVKWANDDRSRGKLSHLPREVYSLYKIKRSLP